MKDLRMLQLAKNLVNYSCRVQPGERVMIEAFDTDPEFVVALVNETLKVGGYPVPVIRAGKVQRAVAAGSSEGYTTFLGELDSARMEHMNAYIGVRGADNCFEMGDVPPDKMQLQGKLYQQPVHSQRRVANTKWVVLRYPSPSMAQQAAMSTEAFEDFYFNVCNLDYAKMDRAMDSIQARMQSTDRVRFVGPGTDLSFSIKGMPAIKCAGECNIPDGEIYTAPVKNSINGTLRYNTPSLRDGFSFSGVSFTFKDGKIVEATSNDTARINAILDTDGGARYIGEFALGVNPFITTPMMDTLFDEKIAGSFHFTPGNSYDNCDNGNKSAVHWDLVCIQTPEYGGGEIYFDDVLIRKDGLFVPEDLHCLNPDALK